MKSVEMTVRRALLVVKGFDEIVERFGPDADWSVLRRSTWNQAFGSVDRASRELPELWSRYESGKLFEEILRLAENLNLEALSPKVRKEMNADLDKLRKRIDSGRNGGRARPNARRRSG